MSEICRKYKLVLRTALAKIANWTEQEIEDWISQFGTKLDDENSTIYHELPSYWIVAALFPVGQTEFSKTESFRDTMLGAMYEVSAASGELCETIEWQSLRSVYLDLKKTEREEKGKQVRDRSNY